jgi:hypothetical protein
MMMMMMMKTKIIIIIIIIVISTKYHLLDNVPVPTESYLFAIF